MPDVEAVISPRVRSASVSAAPPDFTAELNPSQYAAAIHAGGPLLIVAGAGSGKTRTLVYRVAHLIGRGVPPARILLLTFTRRAAQEMLSRCERLVGSASRQVAGGTFHATAHRLLRRFGPAAGIPADFSIMDQSDAADLMHLSRAALRLGAGTTRFPKKETLHTIYSRHVNTGISVDDIVRDDYPGFVDHIADLQRLYADYTVRKQDRNVVDYDDLLLLWALLVEADSLADRVAALYDHVLVDEYQDTNVLQARILRGMARSHSNITVVGDDAQSIYSFRGATIRNILDFPINFPGTTVVTLEQNYRSTPEILATSNTLIARAGDRFAKTLWTERTELERPMLVSARDESQQTRYVVDRILELHEDGTPLRNMAVLFRAGYMSADIEIELVNRRIPFEKWGGLKFLEAAHVKDVLAFLRVLDNPRDEVSWYRLLLLLPGVGDATARAAIDAMAAAAWDRAAFARFSAPTRARASHSTLVALIDALAGGGNSDNGNTGSTTNNNEPNVARDIAAVRVMYDAILRERYDRAEPRLADLDQLQAIAAGFPDRTTFLSALALEPPSSTQDFAGAAADHDDDCLVLSTVHSAKGKEWDAVFVISVVDGLFPSTRSLGDDDGAEEERRLMYVAMTRARNHLSIVHPLSSYGSRRGADYSLTQLSRFIDPDVRRTMQRVALGADDRPAEPVAEAPTVPVIDLRALLRGRFGA